MKIKYDTAPGNRAFLLEEDGTTICEILVPGHGTPGAADAEKVAADIVQHYNHERAEITESQKAYVDRAREHYVDSSDQIQIDDNPSLSETDDGYWVAAWVWVSDSDLPEPEEDFDESMDGDHASALASIGWGTDEDYGDSAEDRL